MRQDHFAQGSGRLSIGRITGNQGPDYIRIELTDGLNFSRLVELDMTLAEFAACLTGSGYRECQFRFNTQAPLGKRHEHKTEEVAFATSDFGRDDPRRAVAVRNAIALFEVGGWMGDDRDASNHHNLVRLDRENKIEVYRIHFHRYVEPVEPEEG